MAGIKNVSLSLGTITLLADPWYSNGTNAIGDFGPKLDALVKNSIFSGVDGYSNSYVDLPVNLSVDTSGNVTIDRIRISYSFEAALQDFRDPLNAYIGLHQAEKDENGNLTVPFFIRSSSPGRLRLADLQIIADEPPYRVRTIPDFDMDQGTLRWDLVDLWTYFQDDLNTAETLRYSLVSATNSSIIDVSITGNRYLSVDASFWENWTGTVEVVVACADSQNQSILSNPFKIYIGAVPHPGINWPPAFTTRWPQTGLVGQEIVYDINATDPENETLTFGLDRKPDGMTINSTSGLMRWVPRAVGQYDVSVFVTDGCNTVFQNFTVAIPNRPPRVMDGAAPVAHVGALFLFRVPAVDDDGDPLAFQLETAPDDTFHIDSSTGLINWTPAATGNYVAIINISDGREKLAYRCFITVLPGNRAPNFQTLPVTTAYVGLKYVYNANATDVDGDPVTYSLVQGPDGMTLDNSACKISWMPGAPGNCPVIILAFDGKGGEALQEFNIVVSNRVRPYVQIVNPITNETLQGKILMTGKAFSGTLEIAKVQVRVDEGDWKDADGNLSWQYALDTTRLKNGKHTLHARGFDGMDYSNPATRDIFVDNFRPAGEVFHAGYVALPILLVAAALLLLRGKWKKIGRK